MGARNPSSLCWHTSPPERGTSPRATQRRARQDPSFPWKRESIFSAQEPHHAERGTSPRATQRRARQDPSFPWKRESIFSAQEPHHAERGTSPRATQRRAKQHPSFPWKRESIFSAQEPHHAERGTSPNVVALNKMAMNTAPHVPGSVGLQPRITTYGAGSALGLSALAISPHPGPLPRERGQSAPNERTA